MSSTKRINVSLEDGLLRRIDAEAQKLGMNRSEWIRLASEEKLSVQAATDGLDTTAKLIRKILEDVVGKESNRLAKMISRDTKASGTAMYMLYAYLEKVPGLDAKEFFTKSQNQAVNLLTSRE